MQVSALVVFVCNSYQKPFNLKIEIYAKAIEILRLRLSKWGPDWDLDASFSLQYFMSLAYLYFIFSRAKTSHVPEWSVGLATCYSAIFSILGFLLLVLHVHHDLVLLVLIHGPHHLLLVVSPQCLILYCGEHLCGDCSTWRLQNMQWLVWSAPQLIACTTYSNLCSAVSCCATILRRKQPVTQQLRQSNMRRMLRCTIKI